VDIDPKYHPDIWCDVMTWEYTRLPRRLFDVITMSPPCTEFYQAKTVGTRDLVGAISVVKKALEFIRYFRQSRWWLDTPRFGLLPQQDFMQVLPFWDVN